MSLSFDPFNLVTLELPDINLRTMKILVFPKLDDDPEDSDEIDVEGIQPRVVTIKVSF